MCASSATAAIGTRSVVAPSLRRMDRSKVANFVTEFTQSNGRVLKVLRGLSLRSASEPDRTIAAAQAPESSKLLWTQNEQYAVYTTAGLNKQPGSTPTFAAATWLNQPVMAEAFDVTGKNTFQFSSPNNQAEFDVATARHIDSQPVGDVDVVSACVDLCSLVINAHFFASFVCRLWRSGRRRRWSARCTASPARDRAPARAPSTPVRLLSPVRLETPTC